MNTFRKFLPWLLLAGLVVVCIIAFRACKKNEERAADTRDLIKVAQDTPKRWVDPAGRQHAKVQIIDADVSAIRAVYQHRVDSVLLILKIKEKQLQGLTAVGVHTTGRITAPVETRTTTVAGVEHTLSRFTYQNQYITLEGEIFADTAVAIDYKTFDSLTFVTYYKRKGLFNLGRKEIFLDAYSQNPDAKVSGITGIRVAQPTPKRFSLGPAISYGFDGQGWRPIIGLSLQYSLIRF